MSDNVEQTSISPQSHRSRSKYLATATSHPRLKKTDASSIRTILRGYDRYAKEIEERARQLVGPDTVFTEAVTPVQLKFCVDAEWIESLIELGFIDGVSLYDDLSKQVLRDYLEKKSEESKNATTIDALGKLVTNNLRIDMTDTNARSRIENLFESYHVLLRRNRLSWLTKDNEKICVYHILSAIRPDSL